MIAGFVAVPVHIQCPLVSLIIGKPFLTVFIDGSDVAELLIAFMGGDVAFLVLYIGTHPRIIITQLHHTAVRGILLYHPVCTVIDIFYSFDAPWRGHAFQTEVRIIAEGIGLS